MKRYNLRYNILKNILSSQSVLRVINLKVHYILCQYEMIRMSNYKDLFQYINTFKVTFTRVFVFSPSGTLGLSAKVLASLN